MLEHRVEIMKGLTVSWLVLEEGGAGSDDVKELMVGTVRVLHAAMGKKEVFVDECRALTEADGRLAGLLEGVISVHFGR